MHAQGQRAHGTVRRVVDFLLSDIVFWSAVSIVGIVALFGVVAIGIHTLLAVGLIAIALIGTRVSE